MTLSRADRSSRSQSDLLEQFLTRLYDARGLKWAMDNGPDGSCSAAKPVTFVSPCSLHQPKFRVNVQCCLFRREPRS